MRRCMNKFYIIQELLPANWFLQRADDTIPKTAKFRIWSSLIHIIGISWQCLSSHIHTTSIRQTLLEDSRINSTQIRSYFLDTDFFQGQINQELKQLSFFFATSVLKRQTPSSGINSIPVRRHETCSQKQSSPHTHFIYSQEVAICMMFMPIKLIIHKWAMLVRIHSHTMFMHIQILVWATAQKCTCNCIIKLLYSKYFHSI